MFLKIAVLAETLATMRAHVSLFSIVNSVNVSIQMAQFIEQLVARWTSVIVRFVWIVQSIDVLPQCLSRTESL